MEFDGEVIEAAIGSGDPDRVNEAVDRIEAADIAERVEAFDDCFDRLTALYDASDDGYVRQSCVRAADALAPGLAAAVNSQDEELAVDYGGAVGEQTDALCGFLLEAMTDEDGRVRQSAQRGLDGVFRTYEALGDRETVEALIAELERLAEEHDGKRREHLLDARDDAEFTLGSGIGRIVREARRGRGASTDDGH